MKKRFLAVMLAVMVAVTYMPKGMGFAESVQARSSDKPKKTEATKEKSEQKFNKKIFCPTYCWQKCFFNYFVVFGSCIMARMREARFKKCRRLGLNVCGHLKAMKREGNGQARDHRKKLSPYGAQLLEKQRLRGYYEVMEKQFKKYVYS